MLNLPTKSGTSCPAVLPLILDHVDAWGWVHIIPPASLGVEFPHVLPPRLIPAFLAAVDASELGLAGTEYRIRVEVSVDSTSFNGLKYKINGEMEGLSWYGILADAVHATCLPPA